MIEEHGFHLFISLAPFLFLGGYFLFKKGPFSGLRILALLFLVLFSIHIFGGLHIGHSTISHSHHSVSECCVMPQAIENPIIVSFGLHFVPNTYFEENKLFFDFIHYLSLDNKSPPLS